MTNTITNPRTTIRVSKGSLAFAVADKTVESQLRFEQYVCKSGVSMAANLREAFKTADLLQQTSGRAQVLVDTPVLLVPVEEYSEENIETLYLHSFPSTSGATVMSNVLPDLNAVALFAVNKDFKLVVDDHFSDVRFYAIMRPVWNYLHRRGMVGNRRKLFAHFHDNKLELFSFERNRFLFSNQYATRRANDAAYFTLFVWKQLVMDQMKDELYLSGDIPDVDKLTTLLRQYITKVTVINTKGDFNRAPMTDIKGITFDLLTLYLGQ
ncbi:MAG: DUF3822 family protein [Prevotella sp.]|jgi:hypothetical protein